VSSVSPSTDPHAKAPPVLSRLLSGTFWLAFRTPIQIVCTLWTTRLILEAFSGEVAAYGFAWGFGFFQFLFEFGLSSALQRRVSDCWTRGDRDGVNRAIACGMNFYSVMALVQAVALLGVAYGAMPFSSFRSGEPHRFVIQLLWLQALTAPCYGLTIVVSSVLQAARRYELIPKLEVAITVLRFLILLAGVKLGVGFLTIIVTQTLVGAALSLGPAFWVMVRELGYIPHFHGARRADYIELIHFSAYMFLIQLSVVLADKIDTTILGFALPEQASKLAIEVYWVISKPFTQVRQTGWMLAYMVMPAVASLAAARDTRGLERVKYDGPRLHTAVLAPVVLLALVYAGPFLSLWAKQIANRDASDFAWLMRLFLVATAPLLIAVHVQATIGMGKIRTIAIAALVGSLVNLPISYALTVRLGNASGVIWGTVLTTLFSNLLVPGIYAFRALEIRPTTYLVRTLGPPLAGALALLAVTWVFHRWLPVPAASNAPASSRLFFLLIHLAAGVLAYVAGYMATPVGRADSTQMIGWLRARRAS
jgi:O-antigen/teichoic acid export membrane protein